MTTVTLLILKRLEINAINNASRNALRRLLNKLPYKYQRELIGSFIQFNKVENNDPSECYFTSDIWHIIENNY